MAQPQPWLGLGNQGDHLSRSQKIEITFTWGFGKVIRAAEAIRLAFDKALVVSHHQVTVDLLYEIECHAHGDQQTSTTVEAGNLR